MSLENIVHTEKLDDGKRVRLTFETDGHFHVYEYRGQSARAVLRGKDPQGLTGGKLVHKVSKGK